MTKFTKFGQNLCQLALLLNALLHLFPYYFHFTDSFSKILFGVNQLSKGNIIF